jgi:hypothetical protein
MARDVDTDLHLGRRCSLRILRGRVETEAADTSEALASI